MRALGSNVTLAPVTRAGSGASNMGSIRVWPVNQSAGPFTEGREPFLVIFIPCSFDSGGGSSARISPITDNVIAAAPAILLPVESDSFYYFADCCVLARIFVGRSGTPSGRNAIPSYFGCGFAALVNP